MTVQERRRFRYTLPGAWVAVVVACLALPPSLLPRSALFQGIVCGIGAAIGYGLGVAGAWVWRPSPTATRGRRGREPGRPSPSRPGSRCWPPSAWGCDGRGSSAT